MKTTFSEEINPNIIYHIGFAHFIKVLALNVITGEIDLLELEDENIHIITTAKHNIFDISFEEWYMSNSYYMQWFNKDFIKEIWDDVLDKKENKTLHMVHVEGYFPIVNCKMKGDEIIKKLADISSE